MQKKPIVQVEFILVSSTGDGGPKYRVPDESSGDAVVDRMVRDAIERGGVWDEHKETFYPWHSIARVVHHRSEMTPEEEAKRQQDTELMRQLMGSESRSEYDPFSNV